MEDLSIFDVIGPVMIGPSSSHTAGASKLGFLASEVFDRDIGMVEFFLHGSFYKTHKGHGTDRALLAGIMKFLPDDENIRYAFKIAEEKGLKYHYYEADLGEIHPNSVKIVMHSMDGEKEEVIGSSVGGGRILISRIGDTEVEVDGDYSTLITKHFDKPGVIANVTTILSNHDINIAFMKVFRNTKGEQASLIVQVDDLIDEGILSEVRKTEGIEDVKFIRSMKI